MDNNEFKLFFVSISISVSGYGIVLCFCLHLTIVDVSPVVDAMPLIFSLIQSTDPLSSLFFAILFSLTLSLSVFCRWIFFWSKYLVHFSLAYLFAGCSCCLHVYTSILIWWSQITKSPSFSDSIQWISGFFLRSHAFLFSFTASVCEGFMSFSYACFVLFNFIRDGPNRWAHLHGNSFVFAW